MGTQQEWTLQWEALAVDEQVEEHRQTWAQLPAWPRGSAHSMEDPAASPWPAQTPPR